VGGVLGRVGGGRTPSSAPSKVMLGTPIGGLQREPALDRRQRRIARDQAEAVPIRMDHDLDEIGVVEGRGAALEGGSSNARSATRGFHSRRSQRAPVLPSPRRPRSLWK
jgi:hypothetical protein